MPQNFEDVDVMLSELCDIFRIETRAEREVASADNPEALAKIFEMTKHYRELLNPQTRLVIGAKGTGKSFLAAALRLDLGGHLAEIRRGRPELVVAEGIQGDRPDLMTTLRDYFTLVNKNDSTGSFVRFWDWFVLWRVAETARQRIAKTHAEHLPQLNGILVDLWSCADGIIGAASGFAPTDHAALEEDSEQSPTRNLIAYIGNVFSGHTNVESEEAKRRPAQLDDIRDELKEFLRAQSMEVWVLFDRLDEVFLFDATDAHARAMTAMFQSVIQQSALNVPWNQKIFIRPDVMGKLGKTVNLELLLTGGVRLSWKADQIRAVISRRLTASNAFCELHGLESGDQLTEPAFAKLFDNCSNLLSGGRKRPHEWLPMICADGLNSNNPRNVLDLVSYSLRELMEHHETHGAHVVSARNDDRAAELLFFEQELNRAYINLSWSRRTWLGNEFSEISMIFEKWDGVLVQEHGFYVTEFEKWLEEKKIAVKPPSSVDPLTVRDILEILEKQAGLIKPRSKTELRESIRDYTVAPVYRHAFGVLKTDLSLEDSFDTQESILKRR